jgi:predicted dithiol-disulfide oxidoreductase (DUF899 family)
MRNYHEKHFPGESKEYREARNKLLETEMELRRKIEEVAELRRKLPHGGKLKENYLFDELDSKTGAITQTKFTELFAHSKNTLVIYSYMYGLKTEKPCTSCTSIMDGINGMVFHITDRINFVMEARAPISKIMDWAKSRNWSKLRILSSEKNSYNTDYFAENEKGSQLPMLNVFRKEPDGIYHFYGTELLYVPSEPGQDGRHVDMIWPLWNMFDYTPEGRGKDWYPRYSYD